MDSVLPIGTKRGCYTIIDGFEAYREEFTKGLDICAVELQTYEKYKCQCKCGNVHYVNASYLSIKKPRYCRDECGIKQEHIKKRQASYPRIEDKSYDIDYSNTIHESLEILECIDDGYEGEPKVFNRRKITVFKLYKCHCLLCGKEHEFKSSDFEIKSDTYGYRAKDGYYCDAYCDCHNISSFQWRTIEILREHNVAYRVEFEFPDLYGVRHKNLLRYDFAVLGSDNSIKCLIECQGEQHFKPISQFGDVSQYHAQVKNDELKRAYAKSHKIPLIEISYTYNTYEKEVKFLKTAGII